MSSRPESYESEAEFYDTEEQADLFMDNDHDDDTSDEHVAAASPRKKPRKASTPHPRKAKLTKNHGSTNPKVTTLGSITKLHNFLKRSGNSVVLLDVRGWPSSMMTDYAMSHIATQLHPSNAHPGAVSISLAKFDVRSHRDELKADTSLFESPEQFEKLMEKAPLLVLKRGDDPLVVLPDLGGQGHSESDFVSMLATYFQDPSLAPLDNTLLDKEMSNAQPEFLFFYSETIPLVPRFQSLLKEPRAMIDVREGNAYLSFWFLDHPEIARRGLAISVLKMDRPDLKIATIFDIKQSKEYAFRYTQRWIDAQVSLPDAE